MVLADTSIWIAHLRSGHPRMQALLEQRRIVCHPMVIGELACGSLNPRSDVLGLLHKLPTAVVASHQEVLDFIESRALWGGGLGYVDMHLLAAALLTRVSLWTGDRHLAAASEALGIAAG